MRPITIRDVAAQAGVSVATASRVLSGNPATSPESRERVREAARTLDFRANGRARSLRSARTDTIGVLVSDVRNPFFAQIAHGVEQSALAAGTTTLLCNANESVSQQDLYLEMLLTQRVDGIIAAPQGDGSGSLQKVLDFGVPLVFVDRIIDGIDIPSVSSDNAGGIERAVEHLASLGHHRVGYIAGPQKTSTGRDRLTAFSTAGAKYGFDIDPGLVYLGDFQVESGVVGGRILLDLPNPPTAIIAADSLMTLGVLKVAREREIAIGTEVSIIGYDDIDTFQLVSPALTVIAHDSQLMGALAFEMMQKVIAGKSVDSIVLPASLIIRESSGPVPNKFGA